MLGGCRGSTGPSSLAPDGRPYGSRFPRITVRDQVAAEAALADVLGIDRFAAVLGGSMGGMRALEWAVGYPDRVAAALDPGDLRRSHRRPDRLDVPQLAAIRADPRLPGGDYYGRPGRRWPGWRVAREIAHHLPAEPSNWTPGSAGRTG